MRQQLLELGCPPDKAMVQRLGVDLDKFPFITRYRCPEEPLRLLFAARFTEKKGLKFAIEALAHVTADGANVVLTVIGDAGSSDEDQAIKREMLRIVERHGLQERVTFRGFIPFSELAKEYYKHHVLIAPSVQASSGDNEGGAPVTIIEAVASGMPVISTCHCDIPSVVLHNRSGFLAPERDSRALAKFIRLLKADNHILQEMGEVGRAHIASHFDAQAQAERLSQIYDYVRER